MEKLASPPEWPCPCQGHKMEHEMSTPVGEKVLGKYKLLSPDFRFFLPMISQQFGGSGSRYTLSFPNLSIWKNDPCPKLLSLHIFFGVQFASGAGILGEEFLGKSTHLAGGSRSARHPSPKRTKAFFFHSPKLFTRWSCHFSCTCLTFGRPFEAAPWVGRF